MTALKRAYADIILNTAKEAAARIMVSERKAMRYQRELASTKKEALWMLLRLKQMLDSKVCSLSSNGFASPISLLSPFLLRIFLFSFVLLVLVDVLIFRLGWRFTIVL